MVQLYIYRRATAVRRNTDTSRVKFHRIYAWLHGLFSLKLDRDRRMAGVAAELPPAPASQIRQWRHWWVALAGFVHVRPSLRSDPYVAANGIRHLGNPAGLAHH